ncbi:MAG TPA: DNA cytosine methyltransferase, partial [Phycisphaerae bacterium]|nr:DNA cytosine methyltransferase [Phycisphaerae bacterium]
GIDGIAPTLTSTTSRHYERYKVGNRFRRLTNVEYARIQGFPDDHCSLLAVYDQYALFGNAVPPPMAKWVMERVRAIGIPADEISYRNKDLFYFANERTATPHLSAETRSNHQSRQCLARGKERRKA